MGSETASTYSTSLALIRDEAVTMAGLCLSKKSFSALKIEHQDFLHPKESVYFNRLSYSKRQQSYLLGRYCAKQAMGAFLQKKDVNLICIENGIFQQPIVQYAPYHGLQISISHTDNFGAAIAFSEAHPMAIDIETIHPNKIATLQTQLTASEQTLLDEYFASKATRFTLLWTMKEALSKILKCGFMVPFEILELAAAVPQAHFIISKFKNFYQYQALSFVFANTACSLVYPKKTRLTVDVVAIHKRFAESKHA
jgi:phosphopantetheinyl transferase